MKCGIGINAGFYRGYLIDDRNLTPHVAALATLVALWSLVYLVGCLAPVAKPNAGAAEQWSSLAARRLAP
jgi:ribose/xylose/arabinose/galactoside ABC-type transport system permease subunit